MKQVKIKDLKNGDWFTIKPIDEPKETQVYVRGDYDRSLKKYDCGKFWDISSNRYFPGEKLVYIDFYF